MVYFENTKRFNYNIMKVVVKNHPRYGRGGKPLNFLQLLEHWGLLRVHFWPFRVLTRRKFHINREQIVCTPGLALLQEFKINSVIWKNIPQDVNDIILIIINNKL